MPLHWARWFSLLLLVAFVMSGCSRSSEGQAKLRLGYFPNLTHATALVGVESGELHTRLAGVATVETSTFNAGPAAVEALLSGALDAAYIGPNPIINAHVKSAGDAIRVIAGATAGGAFFVVAAHVKGPADLRGKKLASPQLGGTQDVALRRWLAQQGLATDAYGGGDVAVVPQENAQTLESFRAGQIAGAWVPEPWATRLLLEGGGKILVDERALWPDGRYVTTHLIVRKAYLEQHPDVVKALLRAHVELTDRIRNDAAKAQKLSIDHVERITGKRLDANVVAKAWQNLEFTSDPMRGSLLRSAEHAAQLDLLKVEGVDLTNVYELAPLNAVLRELGRATVAQGEGP